VRREVIENCELYLGDCMELMSQYPDKHFDLAIVDPPYGGGGGIKYRGGKKTKGGVFRFGGAL